MGGATHRNARPRVGLEMHRTTMVGEGRCATGAWCGTVWEALGWHATIREMRWARRVVCWGVLLSGVEASRIR
jgi:hypothetical protein